MSEDAKARLARANSSLMAVESKIISEETDSDSDEDEPRASMMSINKSSVASVRESKALMPSAPGDIASKIEDQKEITLPKYQIRPDLADKFRPSIVQILIENTVKDHLEGMTYDEKEVLSIMKLLPHAIEEKVKMQRYHRCKLICCVSIGERRGQGVSAATRCIWDAESDCMATYTYTNDSLFCVATVYGVYCY